jgi:hypothetical protein
MDAEMLRLLAVAALATLGACAAPPIQFSAPYNPSEAAFSRMPGQRMITGQAMLRQIGGGVVTCAGGTVELAPDTTYWRARVTAVYGNPERGYNPVLGGRTITPNPLPEALAELRKATCNAQGNFVFKDVPPGSYFVLSSVTWQAVTAGFAGPVLQVQGGHLAQHINVADRDVSDLVLTY